MRILFCIFVVLTFSGAAPAFAQDAETSAVTKKQSRAEALRAREAAEKRIEADMINMSNLVEALSKNMGQLHYLRTLCFGNADQKWRNFAGQLVEIEANTAEDKSKLIRAFNAGYYEEEGRHKNCSSKVSVDAAALAENGRHLSTMLSDPYRER